MRKRRKTPSGTFGAGTVADYFNVSDKFIQTLMTDGLIPEIPYAGKARPIPALWFTEIKKAPDLPLGTKRSPGARFRELVTLHRVSWAFHDQGALTLGQLEGFFWKDGAAESPSPKPVEMTEPDPLPLWREEEAPRKISEEEIPDFRCIYPEKFNCTAEGSEYDLDLDCDLREEDGTPFNGMITVKCHNKEYIAEGFGKWGSFYCNREAPAEWFNKYYNLKDPREEERLKQQDRAREELEKARAKVADLERELADG